MTMFDGQAADLSLSDEALFGEEVAEQGQKEEQPQTETEGESPAIEQTSEEPEAEAAAPDGQPAEEQETEQEEPESPQLHEQVESLEKQVREATARMSRACMEAAELRRENEQLNQRLQQMQMPPAQTPQQNPEEFMQSFMQNPQAELARIAQEEASRLAGEKVKEVLRPVLQSLEQKNRADAWGKAWQEQAANWKQLAEPEQQQEVVQRMAQISADLGDRELWQKQPARLLQMALVELYGLPKSVNTEAILAATEAGRKAALAEKQAKDSAKAGLAAAKGAAKNEPATLSAEEQIVKEIETAFSGKFF